MRLNDAQIFVLLDDARPGGPPARLYRDPVSIVEAATSEAVLPALEQLRSEMASGRHLAGYLAYGAANGIEPHMPARPAGAPLLWFGVFDDCETIDDVASLLPAADGASAGQPRPEIAEAAYRSAFDAVQAYIRAGDIYQANLTFPARVPFAGDPLALYARIRRQAQASCSALVSTGDRLMLSFSPELFFTIRDRKIEARPMKGTALRDPDPRVDAANAEVLAADPKQRAENLMIVDLLRNDLSQVANAGSVAVPELFAIERYPTVHQMVSSVSAELRPECDVVDALAALFPCGSVTGAPKIRAMQVIDMVENAPRGVYTGAIGRIGPDGDAAFNVAIRTLEIERDATVATLGLGSGVVADSRVDREWAECLAKGRFVTAGARSFDLIETMRFDPDHGILLLDRHIARLRASAERLGFAFDRHAVRNELQSATFRLRKPSRVRLLISNEGRTTIGIAPLPTVSEKPLSVRIVPLPVETSDFRLRHKTSDRDFYDRARAAAGTDEVVFVDPDGFLTEGSFTSVFVERDGSLLTPPLSRGLLPGVLRAELIESGRALACDLRADDLAGGFLLGNAVRGLVPAVTFAEALDPAL